MGKTESFETEKLVIAIMYTTQMQYEAVLKQLEKQFGPVDCSMEEYSFSAFSTYYNHEMGGHVLKRMLSFQNYVSPDILPEIKNWSNSIENKYAIAGNRIVNIDPCLLSHGRFVMATTKSASFRVPLRDGIYAELSLVYSRGRWIPFFWTYADIRSELVTGFLNRVRRIYLSQRRT